MSSEYGKRCERCRRNRPSHMYYKPIKPLQVYHRIAQSTFNDLKVARFRKICQKCWDELESKQTIDCTKPVLSNKSYILLTPEILARDIEGNKVANESNDKSTADNKG